MSVESRHARTYATADCPACGATGPVSTEDLALAARWARSHAARNPGHGVHVTHERVRIYRAGGVQQ